MSDFSGTTLKFDISELRDGINEANTLIKTNNSYWQANAAAMGDWTSTAGGLAERNKTLNSQLDLQADKVEKQSQIVDKYKAALGENSEATQKQIQILNSYKAAISNTENEIEKNSAKIVELSDAEKKAGSTTKELKAQHEELTKKLKEQQKAAIDTESKINKLANANGDHADELAALRKQLIEQKQAIKDTSEAISDYTDNTDEAESKTGAFNKALKGIGGAAKVAAGAVTAVAGAVAGAAGGMLALAENTRESRAMFAQMENNAKLSGKSFDSMTDDLKDVVAVTGELDAAFEGMNMLSNIKGTDKEISKVAEAFAGASAKFAGLKFEGLAEGLQETLATGAAVGPFAELIERTGGDLEAFNAKMAGATDEAGRTQIAMDWLANSGLAEVASSFKENNKALSEARQAEIDLQIATNELGNIAEPLAGKIKSMGASFITSLLPSLKTTGEAFTNLIDGVAGSDKQLAYNLGVLVGTAVRVVKGWWETAKPALEVMLTDVIPYMAGKLIAKIPSAILSIATTLYEQVPIIISSVADGIAAGFASLSEEVENPLLKTALEGFQSAFEWISNNSQLVVDGLLLIAGAIAGFKIIQTVTTWIKAAKGAFAALNVVMSANPIGAVIAAVAALTAGFVLLYKNNEEFREFVDNLWGKVKEFGENLWNWATKTVPEFVKKVIDGLKNLPSDMKKKFDEGVEKAVDFGKDLYKKGKEALTQTIDGFLEKAGTIKDSVKDIGKRMIEGVWNGINDAKEWISEKIAGIFGKDGFIISGIKKLLGIKSPARETAPIGEYFMKGFEVGLSGEAENAEKIVNNTFEKLAQIPTEAINNVTGSATAAVMPTITGATATSAKTNNFSAYESELQKLDANIKKVKDDIISMNEARAEAWRKGEDTSYFDTLLSNASAKLDELKQKRNELLTPPTEPTFIESLVSSFDGLDVKLQDVLSSSISGIISGDTSALDNSLSNVGDFLVNGLTSFVSAKMPVFGGVVSSLISGIWDGLKSLFNKDDKEAEETAKKAGTAYASATIEGYTDVIRKSRASIKQELGKDIPEAMTKLILPNAEQGAQKVINYTQNNYSPKALSAAEIYRNNNRALNMLTAGARA